MTSSRHGSRLTGWTVLLGLLLVGWVEVSAHQRHPNGTFGN